MAEFKSTQVFRLCQVMRTFREHFRKTVVLPLHATIGLLPSPVEDFNQHLVTVVGLLESMNMMEGTSSVEDRHLPLIKRAIMFRLRSMSESIEDRTRLTPDGNTKAEIASELQPYEELAQDDWFSTTSAVRPPVLSDYLVISEAEQVLDDAVSLRPREFDEKFRIHTAPQLFLPDLALYRFQCCELRRRPVTVAFLDIDDFKSFNEKLGGEPAVDRNVLPIFMRVLESWTYGRGHVYRYGGDEYTMILQNCAKVEAIEMLAKMQKALSQTDYQEVEMRPTVSIGLCEVTDESVLTNRQVEEWAARAKKFAKDNGKNRIAGFVGDAPRQDALRVFKPSGSTS